MDSTSEEGFRLMTNPDAPFERMKTAKAFLEDFFAARDLSGADGRPLYRYRIRAGELADLGRVLDWELRQKAFGQGRISMDAARAFCLWASEWWHRNYDGGPWKWEPLLAALGTPEFAPSGGQYHVLKDVVTRGLLGWRRTIYRFGPAKGFLVTIMCEGGVPLKLILRENAHLRRYLKAVLEEFRLLGATDLPPRDLASGPRKLLPAAWRRDVVYELAGELIKTIWRLQAELPKNGDTPVQELDRRRPDWRNELPLRVTDDVATVLLKGLIEDAIEVARRARSHVRWNLCLAPVADGDWELRGSFDMPATISREALQVLFGFESPEEVPSRLHMGVQTERRAFRALALVTEAGLDGEDVYRVEALPAAHELQAEDLTGPRKLIARTYDPEYCTDRFPGAAALGQLAWVFEPMEPTDPPRSTCHLAGQGTMRVRAPWALLAVEAGASIASDEGSVEPVGSVRNVGSRRVYRVRGKATITEADDSRVIVETGASVDTDNFEYLLTGPTKRFGDAVIVFLGGPAVYKRRGGEFVERVPERHLEWRSSAPDGRWVDYSCAAVAAGAIVGEGRLRYITNGIVHHSISICVLPPEADIEIRPSSDPACGDIRFLRFGDVVAAVPETPGLHAVASPDRDGFGLQLRASGEPPRDVRLVVDWSEGGRMMPILPFPARRAAFITSDGGRLPDGARVAEGSLAGVRAEVIAPGRAEYVLWGEGRGSADGRDDSTARPDVFTREIPRVSYGHHVLDLGQVGEDVAERLEFADYLDASIRLRIADRGSGATLPDADVLVTRFDLGFRNAGDGSKPLVMLDARSQEQISSEDLTSLAVEVLALLEPDQDPIRLRPSSEHAWRLPPDLRPGPYLICGRQGDQQRVSPLPLNIPLPNETVARTPSKDPITVAQAYAAAFAKDQAFGDQPFRSVVRALATDPGHEDWPLVFRYLGLESFPLMVFPLLRALARDANACAMAAAHAGAADFSLLWERMETFPFAWWQLPVQGWERAFCAYAEHWQNELEEVDDTDLACDILDGEMDRSLDRVKVKLGGLAPAFGFLNGRTTGRLIPPDSRRIVNPAILDALFGDYVEQLRGGPSFYSEQAGPPDLPGVQEEIERTQTAHPWSARLFRTTDDTAMMASRHASFVYAPALTAVLVVAEDAVEQDLARRIRGARSGHAGWFDRTLELAERIGFGLREADRIQGHLEE